jgi:hypothetical protein
LQRRKYLPILSVHVINLLTDLDKILYGRTTHEQIICLEDYLFKMCNEIIDKELLIVGVAEGIDQVFTMRRIEWKGK